MLKNKVQDIYLSFITYTSNGSIEDIWTPDHDVTNYAHGNFIGRKRAEELIQYMSDNRCPVMLGHICEAIIKKGIYGALEIGFFNAISQATTGRQPSMESATRLTLVEE